MKKLLYIISMIAVVASCQKQTMEEGEGILRVNLGLAGDEQVKTGFSNQTSTRNTLAWSYGDKMMLNGVVSSALPVSADGQASATFTFNFKSAMSKMTSPWNFLYCGVSGTDNTVLFPGEQSFIDGNIAANTMPMYAKTTSLSNVKMNHLASVLKFKFTSSSAVTLKEISIQSLDEYNISGKFALGKDGTGAFDATSLTPAGDNAKIVKLTTNTALSTTAKTFYIALPAGEYPKGFYGQLILSDSTIMEVYFNTKGDKALERGIVYDFGTSSYIPMGKVVLTECNTQNFNVTPVDYE